VLAAMADRLGFGVEIVIFLQDIRFRRIQLVEDASAARNACQGAGPHQTFQGRCARQAEHSGEERSSIHDSLPICPSTYVPG
jgi:hypothetical protein